MDTSQNEKKTKLVLKCAHLVSLHKPIDSSGKFKDEDQKEERKEDSQ